MGDERAIRGAFAEVRAVARGASPTHLHLRNRIVTVLVATIVVDVAGSFAVWLFERHAHGTAIHDLGDAAFWVSAQLLTVSSQMANPFTTGGRLTDLFLEFWALTVVTTVAGMFAAFFHHRSAERKAAAEAT